MGLYDKIHKIMCEVERLEKDMNVAGQYNAISEAVVLNEIKPLFEKYKLILFPVGAEATQHGKITQIVAKYKLIDIESNESEILMTVGNGADSQDKGSGKAWTYAYKCLLQKTFCMYSREDTDNTHSDDVTRQIKNEDSKVTTAMLKEAIDKSEQSIKSILATYKRDTGKETEDIKFIKQEYKQKYYKMLTDK